jgi:hypothetical protein
MSHANTYSDQLDGLFVYLLSIVNAECTKGRNAEQFFTKARFYMTRVYSRVRRLPHNLI